MEPEIYDIEDNARGCGHRHPGYYAVSASSVAGPAGLLCGQEVSGVILLDDPIPVLAESINKRGVAYVDDAAVLARVGNPAPLDARTVQLNARAAEAAAWAVGVFGQAWPGRAGQGICADLGDPLRALERCAALGWQDATAAERMAGVLFTGQVRPLVAALGEVKLHRLNMAAQQLPAATRGAELYGARGAGAAVAAAWRVAGLARAAGVGVALDRPLAAVLCDAGASADAVALLLGCGSVAVPATLDWVGEKFYPTPTAFIAEARQLGVSRRLPRNLRGILAPYTRGYLAHAQCRFADGHTGPGIFGYYYLAEVQYVTAAGVVPPEVRAAGVTPVRAVRPMDEVGQ